MAIEANEGGVTITGEHIDLYRVLMLRRGLRLEIKTGMKMHRGANVGNAIRDILDANGIKGSRTKTTLYGQFNDLLVAHGLDDVPL